MLRCAVQSGPDCQGLPSRWQRQHPGKQRVFTKDTMPFLHLKVGAMQVGGGGISAQQSKHWCDLVLAEAQRVRDHVMAALTV